MKNLEEAIKQKEVVITSGNKGRSERNGVNHFRIHKERPFLLKERETTTALVGGLSPTHDYLFEATLIGLGLKAKALPPTTLDAFHLGREFGNNGYCNPAYFTVGNLIWYLRELEKSGLSKEEIIEQNVFFTIGCNAPCRFGMLETEFRMALKDCGFDGFRVLVFQNEGGLNQKVKGNGIDVNPEFFLATVNALNLADVINELVYATRPFEVIKGQTDEVLEKAKSYLYDKLKKKRKVQFGKRTEFLLNKLRIGGTSLFVAQFLDQVTSSYYTRALKEVRKMFEEIEVDRFRSKSTVKITGEFWAITTVGAGNFNMFHFLEKEGAVLLVEPVASLIQFLFSKGKLRHENRRRVLMNDGLNNKVSIGKRLINFFNYQKKYLTLVLGNSIFRREYSRLLKALGGDNHMLLKQPILQEIAKPYYNINIEGGEGYMEIAKNVYYHEKSLCHMVLSLKPFGCMPSTQSDGAQAAVIELNKEMIYLPLETAGEGETNAQSRVLMAIGDARVKAKMEITKAKDSCSSTMEELKAYVKTHKQLKNPLYVVPKRKGVVNMAANFIYHVDDLIQKE
jgi:predicted nucleotide-binding protein (sugar kinase/HSP70/actin superfamily)